MSPDAVHTTDPRPHIADPKLRAFVIRKLLSWSLQPGIIVDLTNVFWNRKDGHHLAFRFIADSPKLAESVVDGLEQSIDGIAEAELFSWKEAKDAQGEEFCGWVRGLCGTSAPEVKDGVSVYIAYLSSTEYFTLIFRDRPNSSRFDPFLSYTMSRAAWMQPLLNRSWNQVFRFRKGAPLHCIDLHVTPKGVQISIKSGTDCDGVLDP